jgi:hypothetical protein
MLHGALVQGAYGAGQELSEQDLGSIPFNAEAVIQAAGLGAAVGAAGEGLFGLAGRAIPVATKGLSGALGKLGDLASSGFAGLSGVMTGQGKDIMERLVSRGADAVAAGGFKDLYQSEFKDFAKQAGAGLADAAEAADAVRKEGRAALRQDFADSLHGEDPTSHLEKAMNELADYKGRLEEALADPNTYSRKELINSYAGKIDALEEKLGTIAEKVTGKLTDPINAPVWGSEAGDIWKAMDDFRADAQKGVNYKRLAMAQIPQEHMASVQWAREIARDAADFTKDPAVWGDVGSRWNAWQTADKRYLDWKDAIHAKMGSVEFGRRVLDPLKMQSFLNKIHANSDAYSGRLLDAGVSSMKGINSATQDVFSKIPSRAYNPSTMDNLLDNVGKLREKALDARGMQDVVKELGGGRGGLGLSDIGFGAYVASKLGLAHAGPLAAVYAMAKAASKPIGTIEGFSRVAQAVSKLNKAIPQGAKDALDGLLTTGRYGSRAAAGELAKDHLLNNQLSSRSRDDASSWTDAASTMHQNLRAITSNPEQQANSVGHAWSPLPPETRSMGVMKATNILNINKAKAPKAMPPASSLGLGKPRLTPADTLKAVRTFHLTTNPVEALGAHLAQRDLTAEDVTTAQNAMPATVGEWQGALLGRVMKMKPEDVPLEAQSQIAVALGRPAWPIGYVASQQSGYGHVGAMTAPGQVTGNARGDSRKFKSEAANDTTLPSEREVT